MGVKPTCCHNRMDRTGQTDCSAQAFLGREERENNNMDTVNQYVYRPEHNVAEGMTAWKRCYTTPYDKYNLI